MHRLLIRLPNWVGDMMMALPAVAAVRRQFPDARLVGMSRPDHLALAQRITALDEVVEAAPRTGGVCRRALWTSIRALRAHRLDAALLLAPSFEAALTAWLAGIPIRVGHATDHRSALLSHAIPVDAAAHRTDGFLDLVAALANVAEAAAVDAAAAPSPVPLLAAQATERAFAERVLTGDEAMLAGSHPIFVNPAAAKTPRAWAADRYRQLADALAERKAGPVLVHHRHPFDPPAGWPAHPAIRMVRDASLVELAAVLERCALYIGNDSGPMHVAAALGIPTVGIFGPSSPAHTGPRSAGDTVHEAVTAAYACAPCRERFFEECPEPPTPDGRPPCLNAVTVDQVLVAVDRALARAQSS